MNQTESTEAAVMAVVSEETSEEGASLEVDAAEAAGLLSEAEEVRAIYPDFNPAAALEDPLLGALLREEVKPTLRQLYEVVEHTLLIDIEVIHRCCRDIRLHDFSRCLFTLVLGNLQLLIHGC